MDNDAAFPSERERAFLLALNDLGVRYLIVGMSAALLQGARGATEDVDVWFENPDDDRIAQAAQRAGGFFAARMQPPLLGGFEDRFDVVLTMSGLPDFASEYANSTETDLDGVHVRVLNLDRILHSKRAAARPKDAPGIQQIEIALELWAEREK
jgi:predicted nucleotidyltransferase